VQASRSVQGFKPLGAPGHEKLLPSLVKEPRKVYWPRTQSGLGLNSCRTLCRFRLHGVTRDDDDKTVWLLCRRVLPT
jgi:hypothetical protein